MDFLRKCLTIVLTIALAAYGMAATASAHAHSYSGFHGVHVIDDHHHDDAHDAFDLDHHDSQHSGDDPLSPVSEHHESGFHSHAAPQFGPVDASIAIAIALRSRRIDVFDPDDLAATARDDSPFKPPRSLL